ncbi:hypothetical protein F0P96_18545 [Hymenobacter busanensis]|uniref:Uncharacterized protein n=1 Tax=Hymenobacter busanensis TaxID=2607656 RepID=A0A7L4ZRT5_9BACT|nr:hypothetical protein [Hymenobacter busanensis]KAA9327233.1 hypothetical protein F0P96_18545 [Hymenobacter busanensis]QHJ05899.1 hypothetical protein GUY19_00750 [Hymenobacter busanensis]
MSFCLVAEQTIGLQLLLERLVRCEVLLPLLVVRLVSQLLHEGLKVVGEHIECGLNNTLVAHVDADGVLDVGLEGVEAVEVLLVNGRLRVVALTLGSAGGLAIELQRNSSFGSSLGYFSDRCLF